MRTLHKTACREISRQLLPGLIQQERVGETRRGGVIVELAFFFPPLTITSTPGWCFYVCGHAPTAFVCHDANSRRGSGKEFPKGLFKSSLSPPFLCLPANSAFVFNLTGFVRVTTQLSPLRLVNYLLSIRPLYH